MMCILHDILQTFVTDYVNFHRACEERHLNGYQNTTYFCELIFEWKMGYGDLF